MVIMAPNTTPTHSFQPLTTGFQLMRCHQWSLSGTSSSNSSGNIFFMVSEIRLGILFTFLFEFHGLSKTGYRVFMIALVFKHKT